MKIKNRKTLLLNALHPKDLKARELCLRLLEKGLDAVNPRVIIEKVFKVSEGFFSVCGQRFDASKINHVFVIGAGKASGAMAEALEHILGGHLTTGFVNIPKGTRDRYKTMKIILNEAGHPLPNQAGEFGTKRMLSLVSNMKKDDLVVCLISGGGSALMPLPSQGISLRDKVELTQLLIKSGATIDEVNVVRKHVSAVKGGQLAKKVSPATLIALIISDVVGDNIGVIASGPSVPDESTYKDAKKMLEKYDLWSRCPESIRQHILDGIKGKVSDTPKPEDPSFNRVFNFMVANNALALSAIEKEASTAGLDSLILSSSIEGEAKHVGTVLAGIAKEIQVADQPVRKPGAIIAGGETTVTVTGRGVGGRNQEAMLSAARRIAGLRGVAIASIGTDGVDGMTDAAGALIDGQTIVRAERMGLSADEHLRNNDSYSFFKKLGDTIVTGPTGTNVNDIMLILIT